MSERNPWTILTTRPVYDNPWIRLTEHQVLNPRGRPGIYGVVHMKNLALGVLPIDDDGCTTLVGQYRFPLEAYSWEMPEGGGALDVPAEDSVRRELKEETGLVAEHWLELVRLHLSNSVTDEYARGFVAWGLSQHLAEPEDTEDLRLRRIPFAEVVEMVGAGAITDAMTVATVLRLEVNRLKGQLPEALLRRLGR